MKKTYTFKFKIGEKGELEDLVNIVSDNEAQCDIREFNEKLIGLVKQRVNSIAINEEQPMPYLLPKMTFERTHADLESGLAEITYTWQSEYCEVGA